MPRRGTTNQRGYTWAWRRLVAEAMRKQPWCSACGAIHDLTGDHIIPVSHGGTNQPANVRVLCRTCNSSRQDKSKPRRRLQLRRAFHKNKLTDPEGGVSSS